MTDTAKQIAGFDANRVLLDQVAAWTNERDRLQELIDTATGCATPVSAAPDLHSAIMNLPYKRADDSFLNEASRLLYKEGHRDARHAAAELVSAHFATTPSEGVAAPVLEADLLALREDVAKLYQSAMAITSQAAQEFAQRVVEHVRRTHGVAPAQPSADQVASEAAVRDAALAECEAICNNVHDQYHAQRLIRELRASGEKGADRG